MAFFSTNSKDYISQINSLIKPTYESKYNNLIENTMNKILNKENFTYDFNADPLYQNYKDQYTKLGKEASMNAAASASALSGGYGNSYAGTAASQANQQYLTQLNDKIPELYDAAMKKYQMETENLYNKFGLLQSEENRLYGQHRDEVSDYYNDYGNLQQGFATAQAHEEWLESMELEKEKFGYQKERDAISDSQWNKTFDYNAGRDSVSDSQWEKQFAYQQARDAVADSQWEKEYQLALKKARSGGGSGGGRKSSSKDSSANWTGAEIPGTKLGESYQFTQEMAESVLNDNYHKSKQDKIDALNNWYNMGYITENDAYILMNKYNL